MVKAVAGKGGSLAGRLGVKKTGGGVSDARQKIIQSNRSKTGDARDKLAQLAKNTDARAKLERIRGVKDGNLGVKQVGGITVTKKLDGKLSLTTKKRLDSGVEQTQDEVTRIGSRLTKTVSRSGQVVLSSKSARSAAEESRGQSGGMRSDERSRSEGRTGSMRSSSGGSILRGVGSERGRQKENVRGRDIDSLDDELMTARVDPLLLKKTVENSRSRSAGHRSDMRDRSPLRSRSPVRGASSRYDYDAPRDTDLRLERRQREAELHGAQLTRGDVASVQGVSPLQGTKVVIQNLQISVSQEDIEELFGDIGALKKAQVSRLVTLDHCDDDDVVPGEDARVS